MTTVVHPSLLDQVEVVLSPSDSAEAVIELLDHYDRQRQKPECGLAWFFQDTPEEDAPSLAVGVRGEVGALMWFTHDTAMIPREASNTEWVDYFMDGGGHLGMPPGSEVPVERVHEAVREFVGTRQRPTCVEWRPQPPIETLF